MQRRATAATAPWQGVNGAVTVVRSTAGGPTLGAARLGAANRLGAGLWGRRPGWFSLGVDRRTPPTDGSACPAPADDRLARLEAVLFLAREPLSTRKMAQLAGLADGTEARTLAQRLNQRYDAQASAFRVEQVAGGYQLLTRPAFSRWLRRLHQTPAETRLSAPALETLAVVAYRQPILRADVEAVRGVQCGEILRQLMERDLVRIVGKSNELGRPFLYGTTKQFLQAFGLRDLNELPPIEQGLPAIDDETEPEIPVKKLDVFPHQEEMPVKTKVRPELSHEETLEEKRRRLAIEAMSDDDDDEDLDDDDEDDDLDDDEEDDLEDDEEEADADVEDDAEEEAEWEEVDDEEADDDEEEDDDWDEEDDEDWEEEDDDDDWDDDDEEEEEEEEAE